MGACSVIIPSLTKKEGKKKIAQLLKWPFAKQSVAAAAASKEKYLEV